MFSAHDFDVQIDLPIPGKSTFVFFNKLSIRKLLNHEKLVKYLKTYENISP